MWGNQLFNCSKGGKARIFARDPREPSFWYVVTCNARGVSVILLLIGSISYCDISNPNSNFMKKLGCQQGKRVSGCWGPRLLPISCINALGFLLFVRMCVTVYILPEAK